MRTRARSCEGTQSSTCGGGSNCEGSATETETCNTDSCPGKLAICYSLIYLVSDERVANLLFSTSVGTFLSMFRLNALAIFSVRYRMRMTRASS